MADNNARRWRFPGARVSVFPEDWMAGVLPATSGDGTPTMPGPTEPSSRNRYASFAGYLLSSNGRVAFGVATKALGPHWRVRRRRVRRHVHRVATALRLTDLPCRPSLPRGLRRVTP